MVIKTLKHIFLTIGFCVSILLPAQNLKPVTLGELIQQYANDPEGLAKALLHSLSQNNRFKVEDFDPNMNYGVFGFYLGLCNFHAGDYNQSVIGFYIAIRQLKTECPEMVKYGYLAYGNASLMTSIDRPSDREDAAANYQTASSEKLPGGYGGLTIINSLNNNREGALRNLQEMLALDVGPKSQSIALFSSLVLSDKGLFLSSLRAIDKKYLKEIPFVMNNIAAGLVQFNLSEKEAGYSKDDIIEDLQARDQEQKKCGIIEYRRDPKKSKLNMSRQERLLLPRIDIEYSIGWGPQKRDQPKGTICDLLTKPTEPALSKPRPGPAEGVRASRRGQVVFYHFSISNQTHQLTLNQQTL